MAETRMVGVSVVISWKKREVDVVASGIQDQDTYLQQAITLLIAACLCQSPECLRFIIWSDQERLIHAMRIGTPVGAASSHPFVTGPIAGRLTYFSSHAKHSLVSRSKAWH